MPNEKISEDAVRAASVAYVIAGGFDDNGNRLGGEGDAMEAALVAALPFEVAARVERDEAHRRLAAVEAVCAKGEHGALRWADPLDVPEWVGWIRRALGGAVADPPEKPREEQQFKPADEPLDLRVFHAPPDRGGVCPRCKVDVPNDSWVTFDSARQSCEPPSGAVADTGEAEA